jgi:exodeoxyribonuclease VII large subunit
VREISGGVPGKARASAGHATRWRGVTLFDDESTLRVADLNARIARVVVRSLPGEHWVRGEVQGLRPNRSGHQWFELVDPGDPDPMLDTGPARIQTVIWGGTWRRLQGGRLRRAPGFELRNGVEVRLRGHLEFWKEGGRLQFVISDVDPDFTLGVLAVSRDRVLRSLAEDGLLERNRSLELATVPLEVGLVTSHGSAAYHDFLQELAASRLGFRVHHVHSVVQGPGAEVSVARALRHLAGLPLDVVALVRGGGSRTDLAVFDAERIARAVALMPVPVLTGIGHEIDTSVVDVVAHASYKTPTACAAAIVERVHDFLGVLHERWDALAEHVDGHLVEADDRLAARARRIAVATRHRVTVADQVLEHRAHRLGRAARQEIRRADHTSERAADRVRTLAHVHLERADGTLARASDRIRAERLGQLLNVEGHRLDTLTARLAANDPQRVLARGWSLTRTADGRIVRRTADAPVGAELHTMLADGKLVSRVVEQGDGDGS